MNIQIDSVGFVNRGAELMLHAIIDKVKQQYPKANLVWGKNDKNCTFRDINGLGIYQKFTLERFKIPLHKIAQILHINIKKYGLVYQNDVDVLLDAGGFQFGDQWAKKDRHLKKIDTYYRELKRKGIKIIFLPQAFGPFNKRISLSIIHSVASYADLIFARDQESYNYLISVLGDSEKINLFPDFTNLVSGRISKEIHETVSGGICIIPNSKMVTHTNPTISQNYIAFFKGVFIEAKTSGKRIILLNHERERDYKICMEIKDQLDSDVELFSGLNALEAKGIIGASFLVISSRFHAAASALSQAVPCLVSSWSHKYPMLLKDYDIENGILDVSDKPAALSRVREFIDETENMKLRDHLAKKSKTLKKKSEEMWNKVFEIIDGTKA
jgi:polysaccharide pyruvyl transferase WcaK-like protein